MSRSTSWQKNWKRKFSTGVNAALLPVSLPGQFFVIEFQKDAERYIVHLDDDDRSSFDLGNDVRFIRTQFRYWGESTEDQDAFLKLMDETYDLAREFGLAQGVFKTGQTIPLYDREAIKASIFDVSNRPNVYLPTLKG